MLCSAFSFANHAFLTPWLTVTDGGSAYLDSLTFTFSRHHDLLTSFTTTPVYSHEPGRGGQVDAAVELRFEWEEVKEVNSDGLLYITVAWAVAVQAAIVLGVLQWWRGSGARLDSAALASAGLRTKGV